MWDQSAKSKVRIIELEYSFNCYTCMVLDDVKRNHWLQLTSRKYLIKMSSILDLIALENNIYNRV